MPLLMPKESPGAVQTNASTGWSTTSGTALTSDTVAHTLPATYTELISSTTSDSHWVEVIFHNNTASNTRTDSLVNIYIGAADSEQVLIPNLLAGWAASLGISTARPKWYGFPLRIPAGSRLSAKHQSVRTSTAVYCIIRLHAAGSMSHWVGTGVECVGATTASSQGTSVTAASAPTPGSLTSIGTTTYDWGFIHPMIGGNVPDTTMTASNTFADVAGGAAAGNLITGLDNLTFFTHDSEYAGNTRDSGRYCHVPAATTLYLRAMGTSEAQDWCIYGVF